MGTNYTRRIVITAALIVAASSGAAAAVASSGDSTPKPASTLTSRTTSHHRTWHTPNECIRINGGDYNACNVGNSGRGDLPYLPVGK